MARKKYLDQTEEQQQENRSFKGIQNKKNLLSSSPPRTGSVLGLVHHRGGRANKIHHSSSGLPALTPEESFYSIVTQLSKDGLTIREMPGDGNCLFRALADQLEGNTRNHLHHRRAVVQYMKENRSDFEPFVEDDEPFEKYVHTLSQAGTFAGNDCIVSFARLHNLTVVIHQLNSPPWLIHPTSDEHNLPNGREIHIAYHNGDHYNSVRKIGDDSDSPSNIRFLSQEDPPGHSKPAKQSTVCVPKPNTPMTKPAPTYTASNTVTTDEQAMSNVTPTYPPDVFYPTRDEDFWVKDEGDIDRLVEDVLQQTGYPDPAFVRDTLIEFNFDMVSTVDFILSMSFILSQQSEPVPRLAQVVEETKQEADTLVLGNRSVLLDPDAGMASGTTKHEENGENDVDNLQSKEQVHSDHEEHNEEVTCSPASSVSSAETIENVNEHSIDNPGLNQQDYGQTETVTVGCIERKVVRLSSRQKKEVKKKERKREVDRRKRNPALLSPENLPTSSSQYSTSRIRPLNI